MRAAARPILLDFLEEFDPGSERTLAAWLRHASRTDHSSNIVVSGGRVSNAWVTYLGLGDNGGRKPFSESAANTR